ncbi:MAG TPA: hypothetical protein VFH04_01360 [Nitrososphaeraceae archaeon]|nr:hypothetical protein [Nitrososphaeraceae archaeon]
MRAGNYSNESDVFYKQAKKVAMNSKERDGEPIGILPGIFEVNQYGLV